MSMFSKLAGLAKKSLDQHSSHSQGANAGRADWRSTVQNAADRLTGNRRTTDHSHGRPGVPPTQSAHAADRRRIDSATSGSGSSGPQASAAIGDGDRAAIARYDYLLDTADPHQIEQVHREAFERLSPAQRDQIQQRMRAELSEHERPRTSGADDLARAAARAEASRPGLLRGLLARASGQQPRSAGGTGRGALLGGAAAGAGLAAGGVLAAVAGGAVISSVAGPLLEQAANVGVDFEALASGIDIAGLTGSAGEFAGNAGEHISGVGDQISEFGSGFSLPGLDDFLGR